MPYKSNVDILPTGQRVYDQPDVQTLGDLLQHNTRISMQALRVAYPAAVTEVNGDQTVTLQPLLQRRYVASDEPENAPQVKRVRVMMPQGGQWRVGYPVAVGDTGLAVVLDRSIDAWMANAADPAKPVDPQDTRAHHINDSVFLPGLVCDKLEPTDTRGDIVLKNGAMTCRLNRFGTVSFKNSSGELVALIGQIVQELTKLAGTVAGVPGGTAAASQASSLASLALKLATFKE